MGKYYYKLVVIIFSKASKLVYVNIQLTGLYRCRDSKIRYRIIESALYPFKRCQVRKCARLLIYIIHNQQRAQLINI